MTVDTAATQPTKAVEPRALESLSPTQYDAWRKTGEIPVEGAPEKKAEETLAAAEKETAAAAKEPREKESPSLTKLGYGDLRKKVRELETENQRLKAAPREEPRREAPPEPEKKAAATETIRAKPQTAADIDKDGKPKYKTYEEFVEDLADWKAEQRIAGYEKERTERMSKEAIQREQRTVSDRWATQVESARKNHTDFDTVALDPEMAIPQGSAVEQWVLDSEVGTELLYYLGEHRDELAAVHKMSAVQAARYLTALEAELSGEEEPEKKPPAIETKTTKAPPPTREVGGRGTAAVDEITKAVADDDTGAYIRAANRAAIARRKH